MMKPLLRGLAAFLMVILTLATISNGQECGLACDSCLDGSKLAGCDSGGCCNSPSSCDSASCCDSACCGGSSCCAGPCCGLLGGLDKLIKPSDHCFDDFISPMSNFIYFEDPRTLTEVRPIFFHHKTPRRVGTLGVPGGEVQLLAVQVRAALTDRLSLIAVKDGFIWSDMAPGALDRLLDDGWADITAGLKYNLLRDPRGGSLLSVGATYEIPVGSQRSLQDIGDGEFHVFLTGGQRFLDGMGHYVGAFGYRFPVDDVVQTSSLHWSNHFDVKLTDRVYAVTEFVWWNWTRSAQVGLPLGVAGQDVFNLFSTNVTGNDLLTQSVGFKLKPSGNTELGVAYEFPLTSRRDIISNRIQLDLILRY